MFRAIIIKSKCLDTASVILKGTNGDRRRKFGAISRASMTQTTDLNNTERNDAPARQAQEKVCSSLFRRENKGFRAGRLNLKLYSTALLSLNDGRDGTVARPKPATNREREDKTKRMAVSKRQP